MDCDDLIDELQSAQSADNRAPLACSRASAGTVATPDVQGQKVCAQALRKYRERLTALVGGCQAKQYLGKAFNVDQIDALDDAEIVKLYARFETRLGAAMTKTLGSAALQLNAGLASTFFPIENQPALVADLEADPFVGHALSSATCDLYHRYGMFLAPLTAAITTMKHCQFEYQCPQAINDDEEPNPVPETTKNKRTKDPKTVAAGRAGAAARKAKESLRSPAVPPPPRKRPVFLQRKQSRRTGNMQTNGPMFLLLRNNRNITVKDKLTGC